MYGGGMNEDTNSELEQELLENHATEMNKLILRIYYYASIAPFLVFIETLIGAFKASLWLTGGTALYSIGLCFLLKHIYRRNPSNKLFRYFAAVVMQSVVFILSIDPHLNLSLTRIAVPLITFVFFDPVYTCGVCILSSLSTLAACVIRAPMVITLITGDYTVKSYLLTTGSGLLIELILMSGLICACSVQSRKIFLKYSAYNHKNQELKNQVVYSFAEIVEQCDTNTGEHVKRTSQIVDLIVNYIENHKIYSDEISKEELKLFTVAAPLHDIGKIKIPDSILNKPGRLNAEEFEIIKQHSAEGDKIIQNTLKTIEDPLYIEIAHQMTRYHHEKWDGTGYPDHLAGSEIPLSARVMAIADVFDALSSERPYKKPYTKDQVFSEISHSSGTQFDPDMVVIVQALRPELEKIYWAETQA